MLGKCHEMLRGAQSLTRPSLADRREAAAGDGPRWDRRALVQVTLAASPPIDATKTVASQEC